MQKRSTSRLARRARLAAGPGLALAAAALLLAPPRAVRAFSLLGTDLDLDQRDFRLYNNFLDASANDNTTVHPSFPGWDGAEVALWKAAVEWGSLPHGDGSGDPTQANLGDGGANFDFTWQGNASAPGGRNDRIASAITSCGGGTLAFVLGSEEGWTLKFCDDWVWSDGPGLAVGVQFDIQGVGCHELGHALGLGHSSVPGATMSPTTPDGNAARSIEPDDVAGVKAVYGSAAAGKPVVTAVAYDSGLDLVTIDGAGFDAAGNEVWFTNATASDPAADPRIRVLGLASSGGGTRIALTPPADAGSGDVLVRIAGGGGSSLSNAFPLDLGDAPPPPSPLLISDVSPNPVERLIPGTAQTVTVSGGGFVDGSTLLVIDGVPVDDAAYSFLDPATLTFDVPDSLSLGSHVVLVTDGVFSDTAPLDVVVNAAPTIQAGTGDPFNPVFSTGFPVRLAGQPFDLLVLLASTNNTPSVLPGKVALDLGASFTQLVNAGAHVIGADGVADDTLFPAGLTNTILFFQAVRVPLPLAFPLPETNLSSVFVLN